MRYLSISKNSNVLILRIFQMKNNETETINSGFSSTMMKHILKINKDLKNLDFILT